MQQSLSKLKLRLRQLDTLRRGVGVKGGKVFELCLSSPRAKEIFFCIKLRRTVANCNYITHPTWLYG